MKYNYEIPRNIKSFNGQCGNITDVNSIPSSTGLYKLIINNKYIYIGRAKDLKKRYLEYLDIINPDLTLHELNQRMYYECKYTGNLARLYYAKKISKIEFRYKEIEDTTDWRNRDSYEYCQKLYDEEMQEAELTAMFWYNSNYILLNYSIRMPEALIPPCPLKYSHWVIGNNDSFTLPNGNGNKYTTWINHFIFFTEDGEIQFDVTIGRPRPHQVIDVIDSLVNYNKYLESIGKDSIYIDLDVDFI